MAGKSQFHWQYEYIMINTSIVIRTHKRRRDRSVSIGTGYGLDGLVQFLAWVRYVSPLDSIQTGSRALFLEVRSPGHETDHSPP